MLRSLAAVVVALSLAAGAHVGNAFVRPLSNEARVAAQVRWLQRAIARGAASDMQTLFPEGEMFTHVLTGLAAARTGDRPGVDAALAAVDQPAVKAGFGTIPELDAGTFYRGWRLHLAAEQVRLGGGDRDLLLAEARTVTAALLADPDGVPASYPGGRWPCDAVVAMAGVVAAHRVAGTEPPTAAVARWRDRLDRVRDPATGLLAHQLSADGGGPRGSSQAIVQTFWPDVDPDGAAEQWRRFRATFVVREAGLVGVREYPRGVAGVGDVDSGPLLLGVSLSASAVTLAAARRNGDLDLATSLDREAECFGLPLEWSGERWFALGQLPVGDAFVAWARTVSLGPTTPTATLHPWWGAYLAAALLPGALAAGFLLATRRPRTNGTATPPSSSPTR